MSVIDRAMRLSRDEGGVTVKHVPTPKFHAAKIHTGPIHSSVAGRTDHLPIHVPASSYVLTADCVSHMGENNTAAGFKIIKRMFSGVPRGQGNSPYGQSAGMYGTGDKPYGQSGGPYGMARGGKSEGVPIVAAGGECVLDPDEVRWAGGGDLDMGHKVLDEFQKRIRKEMIATLKKLAPPKKD